MVLAPQCGPILYKMLLLAKKKFWVRVRVYVCVCVWVDFWGERGKEGSEELFLDLDFS